MIRRAVRPAGGIDRDSACCLHFRAGRRAWRVRSWASRSGAALTGAGDVLAREPGAGTSPAGRALAEAGLVPLRLGPKEGVALLEGVPMTTALAVLAAADARQVLRHALTVLAAEFAITGAARDVLDARLARGDDALARVTGRLRDLTGPLPRPHALQPPVLFRASPRCSRTWAARLTPWTRRPSALSGE